MNRIFLLFTLAIFSLSAQIIETASFSNILNYICNDTLVILDIDDTLLLPKQTLGNDAWFCHRWQAHQTNGMSKSEALEKALAEWEAIRHLTEVKIVEEGTDQVVKQAQSLGVPVMALTTQGLALTTRTLQQLASLNIHMEKAAPSMEEHYFLNPSMFGGVQGVIYKKGVLFTAGSKKGLALATLLERLNLKPQHILFINDKGTHLKDVEEDIEKLGIRFTGLRYSIGDERVQSFDPRLTDVQWKLSSFDHILSDEEALKLL